MVEARILESLGALHRAIRQADFKEVSRISGELETFLLAPDQFAEADLEKIRRQSFAVQTCLGAALQGLRSARQRLADIKAAGRLVTYDVQGLRQSYAVHGQAKRI